MDLDKRIHDFLIYRELKNYIDDDKEPYVLTRSDLIWLIKYLEERLDFYTSPEGKKELCGK